MKQENPNVGNWRTKPINNFHSLEELFVKDRAIGEGSMTTKEKRKRWAYKNVGKEPGGIDELNMLTLESFANTQRSQIFLDLVLCEHSRDKIAVTQLGLQIDEMGAIKVAGRNNLPSYFKSSEVVWRNPSHEEVNMKRLYW
ncbi:hypothetical protein M9H77_27117 [Catharanthus roseus]|uniref:Uncharacterized protein n=1 Tax=Catharanthus roseus TaxID=4058 RepID=A0ACC0ACG6_CATRO|nr:hypothetical protein M9H77_27117 [Catharanthus roseus]